MPSFIDDRVAAGKKYTWGGGGFVSSKSILKNNGTAKTFTADEMKDMRDHFNQLLRTKGLKK